MAPADMKNEMKALGSGVLGMSIVFGVGLLFLVLFIGYIKVVEFLYPLILILSAVSVGLFLFIILPLSIFKSLRPPLSGLTMTLSHIVRAAVWIFSFLTIVQYLGWMAFFIIFMFHMVSPIAIIGLFFKGEWVAGLSIAMGLLFVYGMRFYSLWLAVVEEIRGPEQFIKKSNIIDIKCESEVIQDSPEWRADSAENS